MTGSDWMYFKISTQEDQEWIDKINEIWNSWYHSVTKTTWGILGFNIIKKTPSVTSLPIHLLNSIHNRWYATSAGTGLLSSLKWYFLCPDGTFESNDLLRNFSDLLYSKNFQLFHFKSYTMTTAPLDPCYFLEQLAPPGIPPMQVVTHCPTNTHITHLQPIQWSLSNVFYLRVLLQNFQHNYLMSCRQLTE